MNKMERRGEALGHLAYLTMGGTLEAAFLMVSQKFKFRIILSEHIHMPQILAV